MEEGWRNCNVDNCDYKTKNRNAMRVHLRTVHTVYYCMKCRMRFQKGAIQVYKKHVDECTAKYSDLSNWRNLPDQADS